MILEDATHEAFGYYPSALRPKSNKRVLAVCDGCGKARAIPKKSYHALCGSCAATSKTHTEKHKHNMSEAQKGDKHWNWKGGPVKRICKVCGKTFPVYSRVVKGGRGIYCSKSCSEKSKTGEKNSNWQGGISFEPYCIKFNNAYKESIRELFERKCFLCGNTETDNGKKLDVHHVNYNKACGCDNTKCICVPLCHSCHMKTNGNRSYWQEMIMLKLKNRLVGWL